MRSVVRSFLHITLALFPVIAIAQPQLSFKRIVNNWPAIHLYFSTSCNGQPEWVADTAKLRITENGKPITNYTVSCTDPTKRYPISTALVFDASGSMQGANNAGAIAGGHAFVDLMDGTTDEAAIIWFNSFVTSAQPMTVFRDLLHVAINGIPSNGPSALWDGIYAGVQTVFNDGINPSRAVIVVTDGADGSSTRGPAEIISIANRNLIRVFTIGVGTGIDPTTLENIANLTGGRYYQTPNPVDLPKIYQEIIQILLQNFQECRISYEPTCLDGGTRTVELSVLDICNGTDTKSKTYKAPKDTSTYMTVAVGLRPRTVPAHSSMALPVELLTPIPDGSLFHGSTFSVRYDESVVRCTGADTGPGTLLENVPVKLTSIPGGVTVQTMDRKFLPIAPAPAPLLNLIFTAVQTPTDTLCTPVELVSWVFDAGCFRPLPTSGRLCITTGYPDVQCVAMAPDTLAWSIPRSIFLPDSFSVAAQLTNAGMKQARNVRVVLEYDHSDFLRLAPAADTIVVTPSTLPPGGAAAATWYLRARPRSDTTISRITFTTLYDDGLPQQCSHDILIPKSEYDVACSLQAPVLAADMQAKKYTPDPLPVQAIVRNTTTSVQDRLTVELLLPSDIRFVAPDSPASARKQLSPAPINPGQTASALWFVRSDQQQIDTRRVLECVTRRDTVEVCRTSIEILVPGLTPPPAPVITAVGSLQLCRGDSVVLDAGAGFSSYFWSTGERTRTIVVRMAGMYTVTVTDQYGRRATAPPVVVGLLPALVPRITASPSLRICEGDFITLDAGSYAAYLWNTGDSTRRINVRTAGAWWVRVRSAEGCHGISDTVQTSVVPLPAKPTITRSGDTLTAEQYPTYQWIKDGRQISGAVQQRYVAVAKGGYQVRVTNEYGCSSTSDIIDLILTGVDDRQLPVSPRLDVYPNPVTQHLTVTLSGVAGGAADIAVVSVLGQNIAAASSRVIDGERIVSYNLSTHPAGLYIITAVVDGHVLARKVVKR